jgi:UDP-N-acetylglucosamine--N-acetylmuramyl-(pentapeptide) pyrophosphoryl-undecaprenol N-acetylglucosamine transferase
MKAKPVIVLTGGGSGGHITPLLALAAELKDCNEQVRIIYIGQTGDGLGDIPANDPMIDETYTVRAGKFRRYHGEGFKQLLDLPTMYKNARDGIYVIVGYFQSRKLLQQLKPDVIFIKGGFVGVPVGLAAARQKIAYITHDSDAIPGLANRIIARWASMHAVALPKEIYTYPQAKTVTTGIPLQESFVPVTEALKSAYKQEINVPLDDKLIFIIGGGLGAQRINIAVAQIIPHLLLEFKNLYVVHVAGRQHEAAITSGYEKDIAGGERSRVRVFGYMPDVYRYSGAADLVVTRAGATNLAEFALQGKACIVVPSPFLTGGHQLKNAQYLKNRHAIVMMNEIDVQDDPNRLAKQISHLLKDPKQLKHLGEQLSEFAQPNATQELAQLILSYINKTTESPGHAAA